MKTNLKKIFHSGLIKDNAVFRQILGICSSLAVTNLLMNSLVMGLGLMLSTAFSCATYAALRTATPKHIRMMVQTLIISAYVIILDIFLKAFWPEMSKALGPYVGLIITNCIIMGRCEAFAQKNPPWPSFWDGIAAGAGYTAVLLFIAFFRELLGFGSLFGFKILGEGWVNWTLMIMPPGAFFMLGTVIWLSHYLFPVSKNPDTGKGGVNP